MMKTLKRPRMLGVALALGLLANCTTAQPQYYPGTGHWYEGVLVPEGILWAEAASEAVARGGYLACISSTGENEFANSLVDDLAYYSDISIHGNRGGPWFGGFHNTDGMWRWLDGGSFEYTNWALGQPDGFAGTIQKTLYYNGLNPVIPGSTWGDHPGVDIPGYSRPRGYVVEYDFSPVSGTALLDGYTASVDGGLLEVEVWQNGTVVETLDGNYGPNGTFAISPGTSGPATLKFRFRTGLWKAISVTLGGAPVTNLTVNMTNGDCDHDNEVGIGDYSVLSSVYGLSLGDSGYNANADLNGDETVDIADYAILSGSYGEVGD